MFNSLRASGGYNDILTAATDLLIQHHIDLRVSHIAGVENGIADCLSRNKLNELKRLAPNLNIFDYATTSLHVWSRDK